MSEGVYTGKVNGTILTKDSRGSSPSYWHCLSLWRAASTSSDLNSYFPSLGASPPFDWYQVILLGDRCKQVQVACLRPLRNGAHTGLELATYKSHVRCPTLLPGFIMVLHRYWQEFIRPNIGRLRIDAHVKEIGLISLQTWILDTHYIELYNTKLIMWTYQE